MLKKRRKKLKKEKRKRNRFFLKSLFFCVIIGLQSCGYKLADSKTFCATQTVEVPYIKGDTTGELTSKIISLLSERSLFNYAQSQGDLILKIEILDRDTFYIGFQYDYKADGQFINRLVPNENRETLKARVSVINSRTEELIGKPFEVYAESDYDFVNSNTYRDLSFIDTQNQTTAVLPFSLGQLGAWQDASEASHSVLYRRLATKILEGLEEL